MRLVQVDPAVGDDPQPGLRLERRAQPVVAEPDALELVALVLEREVGVPGRRDRDPPDLALDPQVGEARVLADGAADGPGDLADAEDADAERAGRRGPPARGRGVAAARGVQPASRRPRRAQRPIRRLDRGASSEAQLDVAASGRPPSSEDCGGG